MSFFQIEHLFVEHLEIDQYALIFLSWDGEEICYVFFS